MGPAPRINRNIAAGAALAALLACLCYANILDNQFVFDDLNIITRNPLVTSGEVPAGRIFTSHYWAHVTPAGNLYRPLTILSYRLNHAAGGLEPAGYHLVSILLHAACAALVVLLGAALGLPAGGALAAGALFASHPIHTEAVAAAVGRADLLAAAGVLAGVLIHARGSGRPAVRAVCIAGFFAAGLLSKESAVVLPGLMLAVDLHRDKAVRGALRDHFASYAACLVVLVLWLGLRAWALPTGVATNAPGDPFAGAPASVRVNTALDVMARYAWLLIWPARLSADYSYAQIPAAAQFLRLPTLAGAALIVVLLMVGFRRLRSGSIGGVCALFFLAAIAPVSNLPFGIGTIMGERLLYLPSVAFCLVLPALAGGFARRRAPVAAHRVAGLACILVVLLYAGRTGVRNRDWKDQLTLFQVTAVTSPRSAKTRYNLGRALEDAGLPQEAAASYRDALQILPEYAQAHTNLGLLLAAAGDLTGAREHLEAATRLDPSLASAWVSLGAARHALGDAAGALAAFEKALAANPAEADALYNLGSLHLEEGRAVEAVAPLRGAVALHPRDPDARHQLGLALLHTGQPEAAIEHLREALRLAPDLAEARLLLALCLLRTGDRPGAAAEARAAAQAGLVLPPELEALAGAR